MTVPTPAPLVRPLDPGALRVRIEPLGEDRWRLVVVAPDRRGLLAVTAGVAARHGVTIEEANATTDLDAGVAVQDVVVRAVELPLAGEPDWTAIGQDLRDALCGTAAVLAPFHPVGPASVAVNELADHRLTIRVTAPDAVGLLAAAAAWLQDRGADIESATITTERGVASDVFVVRTASPRALIDAALEMEQDLSGAAVPRSGTLAGMPEPASKLGEVPVIT